MMPGIWELLIILAIALLIFGSKRIKNIGGDLGAAIKGFKKSMSEDKGKSSTETTKNEEVIDAKAEEVEVTAENKKQESNTKT